MKAGGIIFHRHGLSAGHLPVSVGHVAVRAVRYLHRYRIKARQGRQPLGADDVGLLQPAQ